jgi:dienelactone hydrolase
LDKRVKELRALIDELCDDEKREEIIKKKLRFPDGTTIDMSKLILSGHSFGGMTAIDTSRLEPSRVKACLTFDPWLYCFHKEINDQAFELKVPFIAVSTEDFHPFCESWFNSWQTLKTLHKVCCTDPRQEHVVVKKTGHLH